MTSIKTNLPQVRTSDPQVQKLLDSLVLVLRTWNGETKNELDRVITYRDLVEDTALAVQLNNSLASGQTGGIDLGVETDYTVPVQLSNLVAANGLANVILSWDGAAQGNYSYTEVWRHSSDDLGNATLIGTTVVGFYVDSVGETSQTYYYWVRAISTGAVPGAFNATAGVLGTTDPVQEGNFAATIEPVRVVSTLPTPSGYTGPNQVFLTTDNKLYRYDSGVPEWTTAVDSDDLVASSVIAGKIAAGAISTSSLFVDGVITGTKIQAGTITADRMNVSSLSAVSADLGTVTSGTFNLSSSGVIKSASTFGGSGVWLGWDSTAHKFYAGDGGEKYIKFDGNDFELGSEVKLRGGDAYNNDTGYFSAALSEVSFSELIVGDGSINRSGGKIRIDGGSAVGNSIRMERDIFIYDDLTIWSFSNSRRFKFNIWHDNNENSTDWYIVAGYPQPVIASNSSLGIKIVNRVLYGMAGNQHVVLKNLPTSGSFNVDYALEVVYDSIENKAYFYVDNILEGTITSVSALNAGYRLIYIYSYTHTAKIADTSTIDIGIYKCLVE